MKRYALVSVFLIVGIYMAGCGKKQEAMQEMPEPLPMEDIMAISDDEVKTQAEATISQIQSAPASLSEPLLPPLPPSGNYKPTAKDIQTALKNANLYTGLIDGKIGPLTKKAIEEFQKTNGLESDGIVGLKTWAKLSAYLTPSSLGVSKKTIKPR